MATEPMSILRRLLRTESEWNPKVMLGRAIVPLLPEALLHRIKRTYYAYLMAHTPEAWMERDVAVVRRLVAPGDIILDVGASLGAFTRLLSSCVGPRGKVYALEPIPQTFDFLVNNLRKLGLANVEPLNFAASDAERTDSMVIPTYRWGSECWYDACIKTEDADPSWRTIEIKSRPLDDFFREDGRSHERIAFIKCDANGHELAVLRGGLQLIRESMPAMLIEVNPDPDDPATSAYETFRLVRSLGYEIHWFDGNSLLRREPGQRSQNYFFLAPRHVKELEVAGLTNSVASR
jgi:FkbM family methyltransferase